MIYPNKNIRFEESILYKMLHILQFNYQGEISVKELYEDLKGKYENIDEFIYSLDLLYVLDIIDVDFNKETINYVKGD